MPDDLQTTVRNAMTNVPAYLKRGIDNTGLKVREKADTNPYTGHDSIAYVDPDEPNTINVGNAKQFQGMTAAQQTATLAHELTHRLVANAPPSIQKSLQPVNFSDPYSYEPNTLKDKKLSDFSQEQLAHMVETNVNYQNTPGQAGVSAKDWATRQQQIAQAHDPIIQQLQQMPTAVINTDNSQQTPSTPTNPGTINTAVNPPGAMYESAPPITATIDGPVGQTPVDNSQWEDVPQNGSQSSTESDWEDVKPEESLGSKIMGGIASQGLPIVGGATGAVLGAVGGPVGSVAGGALGAAAGGELNTALRGSTGQDTETGSKRVANDLENAAGGAYFGKLEKGTQALSTAIADSTLPSRSVNALHTDIESVARKVATDAGVDVKPTDNVRKIVSNTADAVRVKAQQKMDALDEAYSALKFNARGVAGKFTSGTSADLGLPENYSGFDEQIAKLTDKLHSSSGADKTELRATIQKQIQTLTAAKSQASNALDRQGLGTARDEADKLFQQADELDNLKAAHNRATFGPPGKEAKTNPLKFQQQIAPLHESGQLHTAVGPQNAEDLMDAADRSARTFKRASNFVNGAKATGKLAARGAAEGVGAGTAFRALESIAK